MISEEEVKRIAKLARLDLTKEEVVKMQKDLSVILDYFDLLKSASVLSGRNSSETKKANVFREDKVIEQKREVVEKIISASPDKKDDYIKVKAIF
jgi:aspartyl-tRNA(Asn)/glutamyl-tRNA(Gln) amidotransferase subunit C